MKQLLFTALVIFSITAASFTIRFYTDEAEVAYPEGYRMWTHVKTGMAGPATPDFQNSGGYHHIYANEAAMKGYSTGHFPKGSVIVFDLIEAKEKNGYFPEGKRRRIDVMVKDSTLYPNTGGWGYEEFNADSKTERLMTTTLRETCLGCHSKQPDHVFSKFRN
jgi:hypothetical protein